MKTKKKNKTDLTIRNAKHYNKKTNELFDLFDYMDFMHLELAKRVDMLEKQMRLIWKNIKGLKIDIDGIYKLTTKNRKKK